MEPMATVLETTRMRLREFTDGDLDVLAAMMADKDQMSLYPRPRTRDETHDWIKRNLDLYKNYGFGFWLMESVAGADFLGYCGIRPVSIEGVEEIELGWHTKKQFWGQGLATEAATACRDLAFSRFDIPRLVATIDLDNAPSLRVAHKIGMEPERDAVLDGWPCTVYSTRRRPSMQT
jgi:RimJ/RimL family protein N-acetyltransferase